MENETDEQFEERVLNKRAAQMFVSVRAKMQKQDSLYLSEMTYRNNRKQVGLRLILRTNRFRFNANLNILKYFILIGRSEVLLFACTEEIPSIGTSTRRIIW